MSSLLEAVAAFDEGAHVDGSVRGKSPVVAITDMSSRAPTSAEIDAVIAAAIANAPPPPPPEMHADMNRSVTPLMTNLLPSAVGADGRVNLFVGNLPYRVRWQDLKDLFRKAGTVLRADVSLGPDNRSRGYGTVLMGSREDAARAIDRYNGYTWQTRTLEVRPDRLPPEYEPQTYPAHNSRASLYPFHSFPSSHSPFPVSGHLTPQASAWISGQSRSFSAAGNLGVAVASSGGSPLNGASPIFTAQPLPLSVQNTGPTATYLGQSPLAGSLNSGAALNLRRHSLAPFGTMTPPDVASLPRTTSPVISRPSSSNKTVSPGGRVPPSGPLGALPPSMFAGLKPSPEGSIEVEGPGVSPNANTRLPAPIPQLEGLANQGPGLGPVNTLHDRVIFVSNLPLSIQWQDLKDMLRPAGTIIRADVATDASGKPRGFGTALFGNEADAARAVAMFNEREVGGYRIRATLEKDIHPDVSTYSSRGSVDAAIAAGATVPTSHGNLAVGLVATGEEDNLPITPIDTSLIPPFKPPNASPSTKFPWNLNISTQNIAPGHYRSSLQHRAHLGPHPSQHGQHGQHGHNGHGYRHPHPGPIAMPSFAHPVDGNSLSPLHTRGLPPMTPSMPSFVFGGYPETPGHAPGTGPGWTTPGPFSPGVPVTSPNTFSYNPFAAPGAPVRFPSLPNQSAQGGSAQLGTPTTQAFPNGPSFYAGPPGAPPQSSADGMGGDYFGGMTGPFIGANNNPNGLGANMTMRGNEKVRSSPLGRKVSAQSKPNEDDDSNVSPMNRGEVWENGEDLGKMIHNLALSGSVIYNEGQGQEKEKGLAFKRSTSGLNLPGSGGNSDTPYGGRVSMDDGRLGRR
nr:telomere maintenance protein [Cryptococcus depauperatus CBS 7855]